MNLGLVLGTCGTMMCHECVWISTRIRRCSTWILPDGLFFQQGIFFMELIDSLQLGLELMNSLILMAIFYMLYTIGTNTKGGPRNGH